MESALDDTHLPILENYGLVEYNDQTNEVAGTESTATFALLLGAIEHGTNVREF